MSGLLIKNTTPAQRRIDCEFRETFETNGAVIENGGSLVGAPTINFGGTFDGSNDMIEYTPIVGISNTNKTWRFRVKIVDNGPADPQIFCSQWGNAGSRSYSIATASGNNEWLYFTYSGNGTAIGTFTWTGALDIGQWTDVAVVKTGLDIEVFKNGASLGAQTIAGAVYEESGADFRIGGNILTPRFNGEMSVMEVYDRALTDDEVIDLYNNDTYTYRNEALVDLPMTAATHDPTNTRTLDVSGNGYNATFGAGTAAPTKLSKNGYWFDNSDDYMDFGSDIFSTGALTVAALIKIDSWAQTLPRIFINGKTLLIGQSSNQNLLFSSDGSTTVASATNSIMPGNYYHVAATRTAAGIANVYVNGVLSSAADQNSGTPEAGTYNVLIGNDNISRGYLGNISKVFFANSVLNPMQIADLSINAFESINKI